MLKGGRPWPGILQIGISQGSWLKLLGPTPAPGAAARYLDSRCKEGPPLPALCTACTRSELPAGTHPDCGRDTVDLSQVGMVPGEREALLPRLNLPTLEATVLLPRLHSQGDWSSEEGMTGEDRAGTEE